MKYVYEDSKYRVQQCNKRYIVENRSKCLFIGYYNGHYNLIKFFTKDELKKEFGIEF